MPSELATVVTRSQPGRSRPRRAPGPRVPGLPAVAMNPAQPPCADDVERLLRRGRALRNAYIGERLRRFGTAIADLFSERPPSEAEYTRLARRPVPPPIPTFPWA